MRFPAPGCCDCTSGRLLIHKLYLAAYLVCSRSFSNERIDESSPQVLREITDWACHFLQLVISDYSFASKVCNERMRESTYFVFVCGEGDHWLPVQTNLSSNPQKTSVADTTTKQIVKNGLYAFVRNRHLEIYSSVDTLTTS